MANKTPVVGLDPARFKGVEKAIKDRDIQELAWGLAELWVSEVKACGDCPTLGKTVLMQVVQTLSAAKNEEKLSKRWENVEEIKNYISKNGK